MRISFSSLIRRARVCDSGRERRAPGAEGLEGRGRPREEGLEFGRERCFEPDLEPDLDPVLEPERDFDVGDVLVGSSSQLSESACCRETISLRSSTSF